MMNQSLGFDRFEFRISNATPSIGFEVSRAILWGARQAMRVQYKRAPAVTCHRAAR